MIMTSSYIELTRWAGEGGQGGTDLLLTSSNINTSDRWCTMVGYNGIMYKVLIIFTERLGESGSGPDWFM